MKKNIFTYILILVVVLVWGIVFYRIFGTPEKDGSNNIRATVKTTANENKRTELLLDYKNPFFSDTPVAKLPENKIPVVEVLPPPFKFKGLIKGVKNKIIIVENNGSNEIIRMSDSLLGYRLIAINKDSVVLRKSGVRFCLIKN